MASMGGSVLNCSIKGRLFPVAADADVSKTLGGFTNEVEMNGDGSPRLVKTRVGWLIEGLTLSYDDDKGDLEFLQEIADSNEQVAVTVTFVSGVTWGGKGTITSEIKSSSQNGTVPVTLAGGGKLEQQ